MRGIVTLAAAYALPHGFPFRELIVLCAFCVVVGTLVLQGMTLRPLIALLQIKEENVVENEVRDAQVRLARVALELLEGDESPESQSLRREFGAVLQDAETGGMTENGARRAACTHHCGSTHGSASPPRRISDRRRSVSSD